MAESNAQSDLSTTKLDSLAIRAGLAAVGQTKVDNIDVLASVASTNSHLLDSPIEFGRAHLCVTEKQSAGRGRRGNEWVSAPHKNVMLSLAWGFSHWPKGITGLGLAVALVVVERLNEDFDLNVNIKWPNDLMIDNRKLGGVLIDVTGEAQGACNVIIGLGLNVHQPDWSQEGAGYVWQDLHSLGIDLDRNEFIAQLVNDWIGMLSGFELNGFAPLAPIWNQHSSYTGRIITVGNEQNQVIGKMQGVDANGSLIIQDSEGATHVFSDSNVSVRLIS